MALFFPSGPALANAEPGFDLSAGPRNVTVQNKNGLIFLYLNLSLDEKFKSSIFSFLFVFNETHNM
jgi:hypothetical protein